MRVIQGGSEESAWGGIVGPGGGIRIRGGPIRDGSSGPGVTQIPRRPDARPKKNAVRPKKNTDGARGGPGGSVPTVRSTPEALAPVLRFGMGR